MVHLTEEFQSAEMNEEDRDDLHHQRRPQAVRRHKHPTKAKRRAWKHGIHQRRNKRFGW